METLNIYIRNNTSAQQCLQFITSQPSIKAALTTNINFDQGYVHNSPQSPLHLAAYLGKEAVLRIMVEQGANVDSAIFANKVYCNSPVRSNSGVLYTESVISAAIRGAMDGQGNWETVRLLLDSHCDVNYINNLQCPRCHFNVNGTAFEVYEKITQMKLPQRVFDVPQTAPEDILQKLKKVIESKQSSEAFSLEDLTMMMKTKPELERKIKEADSINEEISKNEKAFSTKISQLEQELQNTRQQYLVTIQNLRKKKSFLEESELSKMKKKRDQLNRFMDALEIAQEDREMRKSKEDSDEDEIGSKVAAHFVKSKRGQQ